MFAIFFTDAMDPFYLNIISFPTVIFSALLILCLFYWLLAVIGLVDLDFLDIDLPEVDQTAGDSMTSVSLLGGLLLRFKLDSVPMPIIITLIAIIGWMFSYYLVLFLFPYVPDGVLRYLAGVPILLFSSYSSLFLTGKLISPLKPIFKAADQEIQKSIVGRIATVRTSYVDSDFGEAKIEDGGAGLILKVRSYKDETFKHGDRIVLLEYDEEKNIYRVISEKEFTEN